MVLSWVSFCLTKCWGMDVSAQTSSQWPIWSFIICFLQMRHFSKLGSQPPMSVDPGQCPPKCLLCDHFFFGENQMKNHKCYTLLESFGCLPFNGENKHRKNCECCHHHSLFKGHKSLRVLFGSVFQNRQWVSQWVSDKGTYRAVRWQLKTNFMKKRN